jgi:uncharacterized cofD-like protein
MKKIVVIGGGTGNFVLLSGLKNYPIDLTAVVAMSDDGSSTGILRDEFGVLPPGDARQCLVALSESTELMRELFNYRFDRGTLNGHSFGNLFLTALEKITGSFEEAIEEASFVLKIKGKVLPVTTSDVRLCVKLNGGKVIKGESQIDNFPLNDYTEKKFYLEPSAKLNPKVERAILAADLIVLSPGTLYTSLIPNLIVEGMPEALIKSKAKFIYVSNLVNKPGETDDWFLEDYLRELQKYSLRPFDAVLFNSTPPTEEISKKYLEKHETPIPIKDESIDFVIKADLINNQAITRKSGDVIKRSFIRHDSAKVAEAIIKTLDAGDGLL